MGGESIQILLALLGKSAVSASFAIIYLYSAELFPTEVRYIYMIVHMSIIVCNNCFVIIIIIQWNPSNPDV